MSPILTHLCAVDLLKIKRVHVQTEVSPLLVLGIHLQEVSEMTQTHDNGEEFNEESDGDINQLVSPTNHSVNDSNWSAINTNQSVNDEDELADKPTNDTNQLRKQLSSLEITHSQRHSQKGAYTHQGHHQQRVMNDTSLARDLVRARLVDLSTMREKLEQIGTGLEVIMQAQLELQAWVEEQEERTYELSETVGDRTIGKNRRGDIII
ncbi:hypothetical protein L917_06362 [Phytophthora nicotianae]|uniref:Uncharacterized protein n=1 Tax=Phytophthora nicotianae TaxID=4792 RepID=W2LET6_PHYNI|nr:hypothetical protein L917_06362 [Phytophthora nicotianae]